MDLLIRAATREAVLGDEVLDLGSRAFDVLSHLHAHADRVVSKSELLDAVWPGRAVEESNLTVQIAALRKVLGRRAIGTVPGVGYKLTLDSAARDAPAQPVSPGPVDDRPSLAVLPLANLTGDPAQAHVVDGITEELSAALSMVASFFVVSTTSTFVYRGRVVDLDEVGRALGVRYVVDGGVQRAGDRIRITTHLVECESGHTLWRDRFDGSADDLFELQDRVAASVAAALEPKLTWAEALRVRNTPTESMAAYDYCLKATPLIYLQTSREALEEGLALVRKAMDLDPNYLQAKALYCYGHTGAYATRWWPFEAAQAALPIAYDVLGRSPDDPNVLAQVGHYVAYVGHRPDLGLTALRRAEQINPNSAMTAMLLGWVHLYLYQPAEAKAALDRARRTSPLHPHIGIMTGGLGVAALMEEDFEAAVAYLEQAKTEYPEFTTNQLWLLAAYWRLGETDKARQVSDWLRAKVPDLSKSSYKTSRPHPGGPVQDLLMTAFDAFGIPD